MPSSFWLNHWFIIKSTTMARYLWQLKNDPECRQQFWKFKAAKYTYYAAELIVMFRVFYLSYLLASEQDSMTFHPLLTCLVFQFRFLNPRTLFTAAIMHLFILTIDYTISFALENNLLGIVHQLGIENSANFFAANRRRLAVNTPSASPFYNPIKAFLQYAAFFRSIWRSKCCWQFGRSRLEQFSHISPQLRARLVVYSSLIEAIFTFSVGVASIIIIAFELAIVLFVFVQLPLGLFLLATIDITALLYCSWNAIRMTFFGIHSILLVSIASIGYIAQLNERLAKVFGRGRSQAMKPYQVRLLRLFLHEYKVIRDLAKYFNNQAISRLMAVAFLVNMPLNIVMISDLIFQNLFLSEKIAMLWIVFIQTFLATQGCLAMITWSSCLVSSAPVLVKVQQSFKCRKASKVLVSLKLKLLITYEIICSRAPFRFTVGHLGRISQKSLSRFLFAYSGAIMYVSLIVIRNGKI